MREAEVHFKDENAGILTQHDDGSFSFRYCDDWMVDSSKPGISPTLPKMERDFRSKSLFPFFFNMLPEGSNKEVVCKLNRIDQDDYFGILMTTAKQDSIGAVTVKRIEK